MENRHGLVENFVGQARVCHGCFPRHDQVVIVETGPHVPNPLNGIIVLVVAAQRGIDVIIVCFPAYRRIVIDNVFKRRIDVWQKCAHEFYHRFVSFLAVEVIFGNCAAEVVDHGAVVVLPLLLVNLGPGEGRGHACVLIPGLDGVVIRPEANGKIGEPIIENVLMNQNFNNGRLRVACSGKHARIVRRGTGSLVVHNELEARRCSSIEVARSETDVCLSQICNRPLSRIFLCRVDRKTHIVGPRSIVRGDCVAVGAVQNKHWIIRFDCSMPDKRPRHDVLQSGRNFEHIIRLYFPDQLRGNIHDVVRLNSDRIFGVIARQFHRVVHKENAACRDVKRCPDAEKRTVGLFRFPAHVVKTEVKSRRRPFIACRAPHLSGGLHHLSVRCPGKYRPFCPVQFLPGVFRRVGRRRIVAAAERKVSEAFNRGVQIELARHRNLKNGKRPLLHIVVCTAPPPHRNFEFALPLCRPGECTGKQRIRHVDGEALLCSVRRYRRKRRAKRNLARRSGQSACRVVCVEVDFVVRHRRIAVDRPRNFHVIDRPGVRQKDHAVLDATLQIRVNVSRLIKRH